MKNENPFRPETDLPPDGVSPAQARALPNTGAVTCFTPSTAITTLKGKRPIEDLREGDRVLTRDRGFQPILWSGRRVITNTSEIMTGAVCPIRIKAHALGPGWPDRDLVVSPGHRLLTCDHAIVGPLGETEALIEARDLLGQPGIAQAPVNHLTYIHLLFDNHEVILSENAWTESYQLCCSDRATSKLSPSDTDLAQLMAIDHFPRLHAPARRCVNPRHVRDIVTAEV